ncbi:MAG: zinc-binding dehydrogenase [Deltaproteobacteria bacterium]|uniref:Zinc-binding dehydrogenase n=1 Tax=Candidatus Zymogenus saltonus TaxID=2844893 RepID=A0A9D8PQR7_9DELT|nr:zinc-binding dehydrogenase [Candidatus Zymogenus saltonus]
MKAIVYNFSILRFLGMTLGGMITKSVMWSPISPIRLAEVEEPTLPNEDWAVVKTKLSGICASDMSAIKMADSPTLSPFASFPFIPGHENAGTLAEVGSGVRGFSAGDRVVVNPALSCEARGMDEICPSCARGEPSVCENSAEGKIARGANTGYSNETGGGWSKYFLAHKSQIYRLDGISDETAVMIDAFCSSLHPVMNNFPDDSDTVIVIGAGPLGLSAVAAIRGLGGKAKIVVIEESPFSGGIAKEAGADIVIYPGREKRTIYEIIAEMTGARVYKPILGDQILMGGVDKIFDTVGHAATMQMSLRLIRTGGFYGLIGLAATEKVDLTPIWFKEITMTGSLGYGMQDYKGKSVYTWDVALDLIREKKIDLEKYVTHKFPLKDYREAIKVNVFKERYGAVKTAFVFD